MRISLSYCVRYDIRELVHACASVLYLFYDGAQWGTEGPRSQWINPNYS